MDERDLRVPIVREGENELGIPESAREAISSDDLRSFIREWNDDDDDLFPPVPQRGDEEKIPEAVHKEAIPEPDNRDAPVSTVPEGETEEKFPQPHLWMQPDALQQEEVKAQDAAMREVVGLVLPTPSAVLEGNAASDIALLPSDEIARMNDLTMETELVQDVGVELGDV